MRKTVKVSEGRQKGEKRMHHCQSTLALIKVRVGYQVFFFKLVSSDTLLDSTLLWLLLFHVLFYAAALIEK